MELVQRYEAAWEDIASRNRRNCGKTGLQASARAASDLCERAATDWTSLRSELQQLPRSVQLARDVASQVAAACMRIDTLERRLHDVTIAGAEVADAAWRQQKLKETEERMREFALREEATRAAEREAAAAVQAKSDLERQQAFHAEYEAQRDYMRSHGGLETIALKRSAGAALSAAGAGVAAAAASASLADFNVAGAEDDALDDFYGD